MSVDYRINDDRVEILLDGTKVGQVAACLLQYNDREMIERHAEDAMRAYMGWEAYEARLADLPTPAEVADALAVARDELMQAGKLSMNTREDDARATDELFDLFRGE